MQFAGAIVLSAALSFLPPLLADDKPQLPDGPGKATVLRLCAKCHGVEIVLGKPHSEEGWGIVVADMAERGMQASEDEMYEVVQYLTKYIKAGPQKINVNKAPAKEIESGLDLSPKEAEAIVRARQKAALKSIEDLKKVVDAAKIELRKDRVVF